MVAYHEYDPYGVPVQDGGDPYGFTGEWWQSEVGLLHLRARWYWPQAGLFLSRDAVESEPPYQYVRGNPIRYTDPSGFLPPVPSSNVMLQDPGPESGMTTLMILFQRYPYLQDATYFNQFTGIAGNISDMSEEELKKMLNDRQYWAIADIPEGANGYVEGYVTTVSLGPCVLRIEGKEIVYDFVSRQRQRFSYARASLEEGRRFPDIAFSLGGIGGIYYAGFLWGFTGRGVNEDYEGLFIGTSLGIGGSIPIRIGKKEVGLDLTIGWAQFKSPSAVFGDKGISGHMMYWGGGGSTSKGKMSFLPIDASATETFYTPDNSRAYSYHEGEELRLLQDLITGYNSPAKSVPTELRKTGARLGAINFMSKNLISWSEAKEFIK